MEYCTFQRRIKLSHCIRKWIDLLIYVILVLNEVIQTNKDRNHENFSLICELQKKQQIIMDVKKEVVN